MPLLPEGSRQKSLFALALEVRINEAGWVENTWGVRGIIMHTHMLVHQGLLMLLAGALTKHVESGLHYKEV